MFFLAPLGSARVVVGAQPEQRDLAEQLLALHAAHAGTATEDPGDEDEPSEPATRPRTSRPSRILTKQTVGALIRLLGGPAWRVVASGAVTRALGHPRRENGS